MSMAGGILLTTEYLLARELEHVFAALSPSNARMCRVCLHTGLRLGDVLSLRTEQIKPNFWITESKTKKRRQVGLKKSMIDEILLNSGEIFAFPSRNDKNRHRTRQAVWKDVKRAAIAFRLPQNVAPHSLRKVYAVDLLREYGSIDRVRRALNHESETTTMLYAMADKLLREKRGRRGKQ